MEAKTETKVSYDDRRKEMVQSFNSVQEIKLDEKVVGESVIDRKATFDEFGIRSVYKELSGQRTKLEQAIKQIKENLKEVKELTEDELELEKKIKKINDFNKSKQMKTQLETNESDLKIVKGELDDIKNAIGTRLKL